MDSIADTCASSFLGVSERIARGTARDLYMYVSSELSVYVCVCCRVCRAMNRKYERVIKYRLSARERIEMQQQDSNMCTAKKSLECADRKSVV